MVKSKTHRQGSLSGGPLAYKGDWAAFSLEVFSVLNGNDQAKLYLPVTGASQVTHLSHIANRGLGKEVTPPFHPVNPAGHLSRQGPGQCSAHPRGLRLLNYPPRRQLHSFTESWTFETD